MMTTDHLCWEEEGFHTSRYVSSPSRTECKWMFMSHCSCFNDVRPRRCSQSYKARLIMLFVNVWGSYSFWSFMNTVLYILFAMHVCSDLGLIISSMSFCLSVCPSVCQTVSSDCHSIPASCFPFLAEPWKPLKFCSFSEGNTFPKM